MEPFAACISTAGDHASAVQLLAEMETVFRNSVHYSVTTSLSRALLAVHTFLARENRLSLSEHRQYASAVVVASRANGLYVGRAGKVLIASSRPEWHSSAGAARAGTDEPPELGADTTPHVATELIPLEAGDALLLLPGTAHTSQVPGAALRTALAEEGGLDSLSALVADVNGNDSAMVVQETAEEWVDDLDERWVAWSGTPPTRDPGPVAEAATNGGEEMPARPGWRPNLAWPTAIPNIPWPAELPNIALPAANWTRILPIVALGLLLLLAILVLRNGLPQPGASDRSVADAGRMIQDAEASSDQEEKIDLLTDAIAALEPAAASSQAARALIAEARTAMDRTLSIVRVSRPSSIALQVREDFRPAGLWKSDGALLIFDLGGQLLQRVDAAGGQSAIALRSGDTYENQALGRLVTATWSPARGVNADGQLLVVDHLRSLMIVNQEGTPVRRWWPPDSGDWQRIGPAAATFDDLFLLDTTRAEVRRYPARLPGAVSTLAARASDEPRLGAAIDLATDGNLYVLLPDGVIRKMAPGGGTLPFDGAVPGRRLEAPTALFAHPDLDRIWALEPSQSRVVELTVAGTYVRQFVLPSDVMRGAASIHVDTTATELRILTSQQVLLVQME